MQLVPVLPELEPRRVIATDDAGAAALDLRAELERLEREILEVEAATDAAERRASGVPHSGDDGTAAALVEHMVEDILRTGRDAIRRDIEEPTLRAAGDRLLAARREAQELVRAARVDLGHVLVSTTPEHDDSDLPVATASATPELPSFDEVVVAAPSAAELVDDVVMAATANLDTPAPSSGAAPTAGADPDAAFDAFWREQDDAADARSLLLAPLEVLAPMAAMLLLLVLVLLFI